MSRGRKVRFGADAEIGEPPQPVPAIGPIVFTVSFGGTDRVVDLSDTPCPRLVRPLAAALALIGGDDGTVRTYSPDFQQMIRHLRQFAAFTSGRLASAQTAGLADLSPVLLEEFEADLIARYGQTASQIQAFMRTVVRLLRLADDADPGTLTAPMQARLGYGTSLPVRPNTPLDAYPIPVLEVIQKAALGDVRKIRERMDTASAAGAVTFVTTAEVVPMLVALICLTGLEPECAKGLRADCLSSPTSNGFVTLAYTKKRAHTRTARQLRVRTGGTSTAGGLIKLAVRLMEPARTAAGSDALWVGAGRDGLRVWFDTGYELTTALRRWAAHHRLHELTDHGGAGVAVNLLRIRKTVKSRLYLHSGGILDDFAIGHTKAVAADRYADINAHNALHDQAVEDGLAEALAIALPAPVVATTAGQPLPTQAGEQAGPQPASLTGQQHRAATCGEQDVFLASCTDFHDSPFARTRGGPCPVAVWGCLECPNAVFTERHLPSLTGFAAFLDRQRQVLDAPDWQARYGLAHHRLTTGIFPAFSTAQLQSARQQTAEAHSVSLPAAVLESLT